MDTRQTEVLVIEHVEGSSPAAFKLARVSDGKSLSPVVIGSPYVFPASSPLAEKTKRRKNHPEQNP